MVFFGRIAPGNCSVCHENLGNDAVAHRNEHPVHRKCLDAWNNAKQSNQVPSCPSCGINVTVVESQELFLTRASKEGDLKSVQALVTKGPITLHYDIAVVNASEAGHHLVVQALLQSRPITNIFRGCALKDASENGHYEVIKVLIDRIDLIPTESLKESLKAARGNEYQDIVELLDPLVQIRDIFGQDGDIRDTRSSIL